MYLEKLKFAQREVQNYFTLVKREIGEISTKEVGRFATCNSYIGVYETHVHPPPDKSITEIVPDTIPLTHTPSQELIFHDVSP